MSTQVTTLGTKDWKENALKDVKCPGEFHNSSCGRLLFRANLVPGQVVEIKCPKCKVIRKIEVK